MPDYIPSKDADFLIWAQNFANNIGLNPGLYMLTAAQSDSISDAVTLFGAKFAIASNELTRTKQTVADKEDARAAVEPLLRQYAMQIKDNAGISDGDKINVGVRPVNTNREPIECPQSVPLLNVVAATPGAQTLTFADSMEPDKRGKPFGASELQLWRGITAGPNPAGLDECEFIGKFTRTPLSIEFAQDDDGKLATYYARWASARGETSPFSMPVAMRIAA
jgi:hypothetical protein